ncbi:MAG TPA: hypothetical protein VE442_25265 [Jatrophihabitans sp.]|nr:hypothetical protein [Jatrophihabitans sp.]
MPGRVAVAVCAMSLGLLAGCVSSKPETFVTVTRTSLPPAATSPPATTSQPVTATPSPSPSRMTDFKGTCDTLLPDPPVFNALGVKTLPGKDAFVVGQPDASIHRLAYLNCRYGVTGSGSAATPAVEIGVSLYATADDAATRITATVDDYTSHGASASDATVAGQPAKMLTGGSGDGYDVPTLVVSSGQRTVAVSIAGSVAKGADAVHDATALAALTLDRTAP